MWPLYYGPSSSVSKLMPSHRGGGFVKSDSWGSFRKLHASYSLDHREVGSLPESLQQPVWGGDGHSLQSFQVFKKKVQDRHKEPPEKKE